MDQYSIAAAELSRTMTLQYSTTFGSTSKLFDASIRPHIFCIYAWLRTADEIVDTYRGGDSGKLLSAYQLDTHKALKTGFSANPIIHAFVQTARQFGIDPKLIDPFFVAMQMDIGTDITFTKKMLKAYTYGSAQTVGLMCLRIITNGDAVAYEHYRLGAESLAAAFQKVNFLRDFAYDTKVLHRNYFPQVKQGVLTEEAKHQIIADIRHDFTHALPALIQLPRNSRLAITAAARFHYALLKKLEETPARVIAEKRVRVPDWRKAQILASVKATRSFNMKLRPGQ